MSVEGLEIFGGEWLMNGVPIEMLLRVRRSSPNGRTWRAAEYGFLKFIEQEHYGR